MPFWAPSLKLRRTIEHNNHCACPNSLFSPGWNSDAITWRISARLAGLKIPAQFLKPSWNFSPGWNFVHVFRKPGWNLTNWIYSQALYQHFLSLKRRRWWLFMWLHANLLPIYWDTFLAYNTQEKLSRPDRTFWDNINSAPSLSLPSGRSHLACLADWLFFSPYLLNGMPVHWL